MTHKNELLLTIGDKEYKLRATFSAIENIEQRTGKGLLQLLDKISTMSAGVGDTLIVLDECLVGGGNKLTKSEIGEYIMEVGLADCLGVVAKVLQVALSGLGKQVAAEARSD